MQTQMNHPRLPWWRVPAVWLVIGGPAIVVVAGFVTLALAVSGSDVEVRDPSAPAAGTMMPAQKARNHAATVR